MKSLPLLQCTLITWCIYLFNNIREAKGEEIYLQQGDVGDIGHPCCRSCDKDSPPKVCYYHWVLEDYKTMGPSCGDCPANVSDCFRPNCITADGYERGILTVNRKLPGPSIQVCLGDRIIVDVDNRMSGRSTTIHWHGVFQQKTPFMDGVPMVTQCPIHARTTFRYDFRAENVGTFFWHSHDGLQKLDGLQGTLVVREPQTTDPNAKYYDCDLPAHVVMLVDWVHRGSEEHLPGLVTHDRFQEPDSLLFDGKGRYMKGGESTGTPYAIYRVRSGRKYRFRVVGGLCTTCPVLLTVERHKLWLIAVDGNSVKPVQVDSVVLYSGERYDFILEADQEVRTYWIHARTIGNCETFGVYQLAILSYSGSNNGRPPTADPGPMGFPVHKILNPFNGTCRAGRNVCIDQLQLIEPISEKILAAEPDMSLTIPFAFSNYTVEDLSVPGKFVRYFQPRENVLLASTMNGIMHLETPSPMLSQWQDIPRDAICPVGDDNLPKCPKDSDDEPCSCTQVIPVPLKIVLEVAIVDEGLAQLNHPFHLHGYAFYVMAMGQFEPGQTIQDVIQAVHSGNLRLSPAPPLKDTIAVPSLGYCVFRVFTNNPGFWFFHCHFVVHLHTGMALVFRVGRKSDLVKPPPRFPKCGNFLPPLFPDNDVFKPSFY